MKFKFKSTDNPIPHMKKIPALLCCALLGVLSARADVLFQDAFNYPDGLVETDGLWQVYAPATPVKDAHVENNRLILNQTHSDAVDAPFTNDTGSSIVYASFTINVSSLPSVKGGFFEELQDTNENYVGHVFIATTNTVVPGTYRLGVNNFSTAAATASYFPLDLATDITYVVVFSYDTNSADALPNATLAVNPASESDFDASPAYGTDTAGTAAQNAVVLSRIGFSQYANQGVAAIGNVFVGTTFSDVFTNTPQIPVLGIQPQSTGLFSGDNLQLYTAASGLGQLTYQWLANGVPLADDGVTVIGSVSNVLTLANLQQSANYSVVIANSAGSVTSRVAVAAVNTTPTPPYFLIPPQSTTNSLGSTLTLTALASGTGPLNYAWYFEPTNGGGFSPVGTGPTLTLTAVTFTQSGYYYVTVTGGAGSPQNSATVNVLVAPPPTVPIAYLHSLMTTNVPGDYDLNGTAIYTVQGVVTTFGPFSAAAKTYAEYYIQDNSGGIYVYIGGAGTNYAPPAGSLVSVTGPVQVYGGQLEIDPQVSGASAATNGFTILSANQPLPTPQPLNFSLMATNPLGTYGVAIQNALVTLTNAYFYKTKAGAAYASTATFYSNGYTSFYLTQGPFNSVTNANTLEIFVPTYGGLATNLADQLIPGQAYQVTGVMANYNGAAELDVTRLQDFVLAPPAPFAVGLTVSNGVSRITWPAATGSTYSVYTATNLPGPWTQTFGLSYYPSTGAYAVTNGPGAQFFRVSTP